MSKVAGKVTEEVNIALSTGNDRKSGGGVGPEPMPSFGSPIDRRSGNVKRDTTMESLKPGDDEQRNEIEAEEAPTITEKIPEMASYENFNHIQPKSHKKRTQYKDQYAYVEPKPHKATTVADWNQEHWMERDSEPKPISGNAVHWTEHETRIETEAPMFMNDAIGGRKSEPLSDEKKDKEEKPGNLQALVDAIGTRMRDIEHVVQKMTSNVHPNGDGTSAEMRTQDKENSLDVTGLKPKQPSLDAANYKRFSEQRHGSQYIHGSEYTTEPPIFIEDSNLNAGYYSDASNSLLRRAGPKEPQATYMAPVNTETRRVAQSSIQSSQEEPKHKKRVHKKKKTHKGHKKHHNKDERKKFNKISSPEIERTANAVSLEDSAMMQ